MLRFRKYNISCSARIHNFDKEGAFSDVFLALSVWLIPPFYKAMLFEKSQNGQVGFASHQVTFCSRAWTHGFLSERALHISSSDIMFFINLAISGILFYNIYILKKRYKSDILKVLKGGSLSTLSQGRL